MDLVNFVVIVLSLVKGQVLLTHFLLFKNFQYNQIITHFSFLPPNSPIYLSLLLFQTSTLSPINCLYIYILKCIGTTDNNRHADIDGLIGGKPRRPQCYTTICMTRSNKGVLRAGVIVFSREAHANFLCNSKCQVFFMFFICLFVCF